MSLKYTLYIADREKSMYTFRPVLVEGYRNSISASGFLDNMKKIAHDMAYGKHKTLKVYDYTFTDTHLDDIDMHNKAHLKCGGKKNLYEIRGEPIALKDYYEEIGWDYKAKKLNGLTIRQHINKKMAERTDD